MPPATVLIIDTEPLEATELQAMLSGDGYGFEVVDSADAARTRIAEARDDLDAVLLDWEMPGDDSPELLRWIKAAGGIDDVEVVVHASGFDAEQIKRGIDHGAYYYLTKPFDGEQLEAIVRAAVSTRRLRTRLSDRVRETEDAFRMLDLGRFRFKTIPEGDLLAVHIASACEWPDAALGLRELMVNAVEHGNLGITYDEKSALMDQGDLEAERERRLASPKHASKRVEVTVQRLPGSIEITIRDAGGGFDFRRYMRLDESRLFDLHGRGVLMATSTLDVEYLEPGNQVRVRIPMAGSTATSLEVPNG